MLSDEKVESLNDQLRESAILHFGSSGYSESLLSPLQDVLTKNMLARGPLSFQLLDLSWRVGSGNSPQDSDLITAMLPIFLLFVGTHLQDDLLDGVLIKRGKETTLNLGGRLNSLLTAVLYCESMLLVGDLDRKYISSTSDESLIQVFRDFIHDLATNEWRRRTMVGKIPSLKEFNLLWSCISHFPLCVKSGLLLGQNTDKSTETAIMEFSKLLSIIGRINRETFEGLGWRGTRMSEILIREPPPYPIIVTAAQEPQSITEFSPLIQTLATKDHHANNLELLEEKLLQTVLKYDGITFTLEAREKLRKKALEASAKCSGTIEIDLQRILRQVVLPLENHNDSR